MRIFNVIFLICLLYPVRSFSTDANDAKFGLSVSYSANDVDLKAPTLNVVLRYN